MTYRKAQDYLNSFINYESLNAYPYKSSFRLERLQRLLHFLGNPHKSLLSIHIAGTKGKGSTCAFVANILKEANFKVGLYTSPHLVDIRERIRIFKPSGLNHQNSARGMISREDFTRFIEKIRPYAERLRETDLGRLSYFEILTTCAFLYFKEKKVDFAVLETGLGGRLDATNLVSSLVCAITPISYEHTRILGNSLEKIAKEKAGIIKLKRQVVVTAPQRPQVLRIIKRRAERFKATLFEVGKDIRLKEKSLSICGHCFDVEGILAKYPGLHIRLLGKHQLINAACAIGCVESLSYHGIRISSGAIRLGLRNTHWPGRLQIISRRPEVVLDAAHNPASCTALRKALFRLFKFRNLILVLGISGDKDIQGILRELLPCSSRIILTKAKNPRAVQPGLIKNFIKTNSKPLTLTEDHIEALKIARRSAGREDLILVCGSIFLIGEVLKSQEQWRNYF